MNIEVRSLSGTTFGQGEIPDVVALALHVGDQVVFPFMFGCWIIKVRHILISLNGHASMTLLVVDRGS